MVTAPDWGDDTVAVLGATICPRVTPSRNRSPGCMTTGGGWGSMAQPEKTASNGRTKRREDDMTSGSQSKTDTGARVVLSLDRRAAGFLGVLWLGVCGVARRAARPSVGER